jgi:hypothetical protein
MGVLMVSWRWLVSLVSRDHATPPGPPAATVGALGVTLATFAGYLVVSGRQGRLLLGVAAAVAAVLLAKRDVAARAAVLLLAGVAMGSWLLAAKPALADDGGEAECGGEYVGCAGLGTLAELALLGGLAAGVGALLGESLGELGSDEGEDDEGGGPDDDGVPCGPDEAESEASDWEKWSLAHPRGSWDEFMAERIERSRQEALAKGAKVDAVIAELQQLAAEEDRLLADLQTTYDPAKPWGRMSNKEKAVARAQMTRVWRQANPTGDPTEFMTYLQRLDADPSLSSVDMVQYIAGEALIGLPGATWDAMRKTFVDTSGAIMSSREFAGNMFNNWLEDAQSGEQADRLGRLFIDPVSKFWDDVYDRGPSAMLTDMKNSGVKVTQAGAKQFDSAMQQLHLAMITGDAPAISKVLDSAAGSMISDYLLSLGTGAVVGVAKKGVATLRGGPGSTLVKGVETILEGDEIALDTPAKRAAVGHSESAAQGFQDAVDKSNNRLQMQRRGTDAIQHEGKAYMKPQGGKYAKSVNPLDRHIGGPDEEGLLAFYEPVDPLAAPGSPLQKRYETVKTLFDSVPGSNLAEKQAYLTKQRLEVWVNGEKVKIPVKFDDKGVMRHAQTGRPITSDYDGWAVLDENGRRLGYDEAGKRLTGAQKQADRQRKIPMIRDMVDDARTNLQHAPTSSEWGPIPAILEGDMEKASSCFSCAVKKLGDNIVDAARREGVVEYRPGEKHPFLTKAAGILDAKSPTLRIPGLQTPPGMREKAAAGLRNMPGKLASSAVGDVKKKVAGSAVNAAGAAQDRKQKQSAPTRPSKSTGKGK